MTARRRLALGGCVVALLLAAVACSPKKSAAAPLKVFVSTSITKSPWVGQLTERGARLAVDEINDAGGVQFAGSRRRLGLEVLDHQNSPQTAQDQARRAAEAGAVAFITDGVGAAAVAAVTGPARLPTFVTFEGSRDLVDVVKRPTLFRLAPANKNMARRLADYLASHAHKVAVLYDDSGYGQEGGRDLTQALAGDQLDPVSRIEVPSDGGEPAAQVLQARRSGADTVIVWGGAPTVAAVVKAVHLARWDVPVYSSPTGEDPLVRQSLADHPGWVDGLTFVSFRITAEVGPAPYDAFRRAFEKRFGVERVGVRVGGHDVVQPPDWSMYPYDAVRLLAAALAKASALGQPLIDQLNTVTVTGANGDERNFSERNHEGVSADDMYFARFHAMRFLPVTDDLLSRALPAVAQ
jgi:ABC-type branched-subunit amino acid transport system substrate-binding protein